MAYQIYLTIIYNVFLETILYHFLFRFIPDFIWRILFKTDEDVRCSLDFKISQTSLKSKKSKLFTPKIGYSSKKGIIILAIS